MDKQNLIESAKKLKKVSTNSTDEYLLKSDKLISKINEKMLQRDDIQNLVGKINFIMMKDNHSNHVRFIGSIFKFYNPEIFVDTILWVFRAYRSRGFHSNYWAAQLNTWMEILKIELTQEAYKDILPYYEWMQVNIPLFVKFSDEKLGEINK